tara:strand:- start:44 stop:319 length:276 start_codon:yes stop_codon:yes gene_type:complete
MTWEDILRKDMDERELDEKIQRFLDDTIRTLMVPRIAEIENRSKRRLTDREIQLLLQEVYPIAEERLKSELEAFQDNLQQAAREKLERDFR